MVHWLSIRQLHHVDVLFLSIPRNLLNRERVDKSQSFTMVPAKFPGHFKKSITIRSNGKK